MVGLDGGAPRKILGATPRSYTRGFPTEFAWPAFSPDGTKIAYFDGMGDHDNTLRVMNIDGTGGRVVLKDVGMMRNSAGLRHLAWSPDGTRLLFQMGYGPYQIYTVNADGSGLTKVAQGTHPAWSPDGTRISYTLAGGLGSEGTEGVITIADADGSHARDAGAVGVSGPWNPAPRSVRERAERRTGSASALRLHVPVLPSVDTGMSESFHLAVAQPRREP